MISKALIVLMLIRMGAMLILIGLIIAAMVFDKPTGGAFMSTVWLIVGTIVLTALLQIYSKIATRS